MNCETCFRTNYFKVTSEEEYNKIFETLCAEDIEDISYTDAEGIVWHGFGGYGALSYIDGDFEEWIALLQPLLPSDDACIIFETCNEGLRYVSGCSTVITNTKFDYIGLESKSIQLARQMLNNDDWETSVDY